MNSILRNVNKIPALFTFKLNLAKEYQPFIYDLIRMAIIHTMINILSHAANPSEIELFGSNYFTILCFILIGVSTYWLIVNKIIRFEFVGKDDCVKNVEKYSQSSGASYSSLNEADEKTVETLEDAGNNVVPNDENANDNASCK